MPDENAWAYIAKKGSVPIGVAIALLLGVGTSYNSEERLTADQVSRIITDVEVLKVRIKDISDIRSELRQLQIELKEIGKAVSRVISIMEERDRNRQEFRGGPR